MEQDTIRDLASRDCDAASPQTGVVALLLLTAFSTPAAPPINDPSAPNIGKIGNIPPRFAIRSTRFVFFFAFTFVISMPIFVLAFIAAQTVAAAALLSKSRISRANTFPRDRCYANRLCRARDTPRPTG